MSDLTVFYVLDLSASMQGEKLDILNHAIEECNDTLSELAKEKNADLFTDHSDDENFFDDFFSDDE